MALFRHRSSLQITLSLLLLAVFTVNVAAAVSCCGFPPDMPMKMSDSGSMPCHEKDTLDPSDDCCQSCVSIVTSISIPVGYTPVAPATLEPFLVNIPTRPTRLYRPPIEYLS